MVNNKKLQLKLELILLTQEEIENVLYYLINFYLNEMGEIKDISEATSINLYSLEYWYNEYKIKKADIKKKKEQDFLLFNEIKNSLNEDQLRVLKEYL